MVTGLFPDRESAERAYGSMVERGYGQDDVNLIMSDETRKKQSAAYAPRFIVSAKILSAKKIVALKSVRHFAGGRPPKKPAICQVLPLFA